MNERIREIAHGGTSDFLCECANAACREVVLLTLEAYKAVRSVPANFFVLVGHEDSRLEAVVRREEGYLVVEKTVPLPADS